MIKSSACLLRHANKFPVKRKARQLPKLQHSLGHYHRYSWPSWADRLEGSMPWHKPADLGWLRETTVGSAVIVGRRTLATMPTLIGRNVLVFDSDMTPSMLIEHASSGPSVRQPIFIAGGAHVYRVFAPFVNRFLLINHIDYDGDADARLPFGACNIPQISGRKKYNSE